MNLHRLITDVKMKAHIFANVVMIHQIKMLLSERVRFNMRVHSLRDHSK